MKKSRLFLLALMLVLLVSVCLAGCQEKEPEVTEPPVMEAYYNLEGAEYNNNGVSSRPAEADGTYKVMFNYKRQLVTKTVKADQELINKIDSMNVLGLVCDEAGVVVGVKTVEEMGGKIVADGYYVLAAARAKIEAYQNKDFSDAGIELSVPSRYASICDVTVLESNPNFSYTDFLKGDQIVAVEDAQGVITDVFFYQGGDIRNGKDQYCPHCKETVHFEAWQNEHGKFESSGHYFLYKDLELADQCSVAEKVKFVLDLNGYTVFCDNDNKRIVSVHNPGGYLAVMDSSAEQTGKILNNHAKQQNNGSGGCVWVRYGTFELFSGTLDASTCVSGGYGAAVNVPSGSVFNMYGGTILGGTSIAMDYTDGNGNEAKTAGGHGGAIYLQGTFNMYGGKIEGGTALANGTNRGRGGCIAITGNGIFNMYDGEIIGGYDDGGYDEGLMYVAKGCQFNQIGGTVKEAPPKTETPSETPSETPTETPSTEG